jgi:hypothetical protein
VKTWSSIITRSNIETLYPIIVHTGLWGRVGKQGSHPTLVGSYLRGVSVVGRTFSGELRREEKKLNLTWDNFWLADDAQRLLK